MKKIKNFLSILRKNAWLLIGIMYFILGLLILSENKIIAYGSMYVSIICIVYYIIKLDNGTTIRR